MGLTTDQQNYGLRIADTSLILSHRLSEWCGHAPILEQDIALTNIALDLIGQARYLYQGIAQEQGKTEDELAYLRTENKFRNPLLVEQPNMHFGHTVLRQYFVDAYRNLLFTTMQNCGLEFFEILAHKALKETAYHLQFSRDWVIRLGDGTEESQSKMQESLNTLWTYTEELFERTEEDLRVEAAFPALGVSELQQQWKLEVEKTLEEATLSIPESTWPLKGGVYGNHSEHMGYILADMQYLQRTYPNCNW